MPFKLGSTSLAKLEGVHPDLVKVVKRAIQLTPTDFRVLEGRRSAARQLALYKAGASKIKSGGRHQSGHAIDFAALQGGKISWHTSLYFPIVNAFKQAAKELGITIRCGADWKSFPDLGHIELPAAKYPA